MGASRKTATTKVTAKRAGGAAKAKSDEIDAAALIAAARAAAFTNQSPGPAFKHFRLLAEAVPTEDLPIFTGQPLLMRANIRAALTAIERAAAGAGHSGGAVGGRAGGGGAQGGVKRFLNTANTW